VRLLRELLVPQPIPISGRDVGYYLRYGEEEFTQIRV